MKAKSKDEAKKLAKAHSLVKSHKDVAVYIIHCSRTECFYVDDIGMIRLWERLVGYYVNGVYTAERSRL
ncbi:MAG TPA: DNA-binding protein [Bacteroidia bacterium]|nr:DNA-binding protein [Bacteroidia bacterium]